MKLDFAFLADAATISENGLFAVVGGGVDVLTPQGFPAIKYAMALVGRIVFEAQECGKTYLLHGEIVGPGETILPPDMWLSLEPFSHPRDPQGENWITICLNYQGVTFPAPGSYFIRLSVGSEVLGRVKIEVLPLGDQP
jgi:hypothetical protein